MIMAHRIIAQLKWQCCWCENNATVEAAINCDRPNLGARLLLLACRDTLTVNAAVTTL